MPVGEGQLAPRQRLGGFLHGVGFAGERRLHHLEPRRLQQAQIRRYQVARLQQHDVARYQCFGGDLQHLSVTPHPGCRRGQFFQCRHGFFRTVFLDEADDRVEQDDDRDGDGVLGIADRAGNHGGGEQHQDHEVRELVEENAPHRAPFGFGQRVRAVALQTGARFGSGKAAHTIGIQRTRRLLDGKGVPEGGGLGAIRHG